MGLVALLASNDDEKRGEGNEISPEYASVELETPRSSRIIDPSLNGKTSAVVPVDAQRRGLSLLLAQRQSLPQNGGREGAERQLTTIIPIRAGI